MEAWSYGTALLRLKEDKAERGHSEPLAPQESPPGTDFFQLCISELLPAFQESRGYNA